MGERARNTDFNQDRYSEDEQYSDTFCSDIENSYASTLSSAQKAYRTPSVRKKGTKIHSSDCQAHHQGPRKIFCKIPSNRRGFRLRYRSVSREPAQKDIDLLTKRVLSARLLKINELQNEVTELQTKLDELLKENKALKRLQYKQEKALNKFEDTENEISQLIVRHNNEIKVLKERLKKSQDKERTSDKKVKDKECELYKTKCSLMKLKKLSESKHLPEREDLAKKLVLAESKLDDTEKKIKELSKNLELNNSSYQRQLHAEKKRAHDAQDENKILQREVQRLYQKLREKERELDVKNIYSNRILKRTPKKDRDASPRKNASVNQNVKGIYSTKGVQTSEYCKEDNLPSSLAFVSQASPKPEEEEFLTLGKDNSKDEEEAETPSTEREEKLTKDEDLCVIKQKAEIFQDDWAQEHLKENPTESVVLMDKEQIPTLEKAVYQIEDENQQKSEEEEEEEEAERLKKEMLLAKLNEIDREIQTSLNLRSSHSKLISPEKKSQSFRFSESSERLFNGFRNQDSSSISTSNDDQRRSSVWSPASDFTFGGYVPSFGKTSGRSSLFNQKTDITDFLRSNKDSGDLSIKKENKTDLMEQLFGASVSSTISSKNSASPSLTNSKGDFDSLNVLPRDKVSGGKGQDEDEFFLSEERSFNSNRHQLKHTNSRPAVKAVDSLEDEIEEVVLR